MELELDELMKEGIGKELVINDGNAETVLAIVELDSYLVTTDRLGEQAGRVRVTTANEARLNAAKTLVYNGHTYHINGNGTPEHGLVVFEILRALAENTKTNLFDLQDRQADFHD